MAAKHPSPILPFPSTTSREHFGSWLSGLTDGEGCFVLAFRNQKGGGTPQCRFVICLRADDTPVLVKIRSFLGCGHLIPKRAASSRHGQQMSFVVSSGVDLLRVVVPHFVRFPLEAKKAKDFIRWRAGIELFCRVSGRKLESLGRSMGGRHLGFRRKWTADELAEFETLRRTLNAGRLYNAAAVTLPPPRPPRPEPPSLFDGLP
jgi:hypothetical protein